MPMNPSSTIEAPGSTTTEAAVDMKTFRREIAGLINETKEKDAAFQALRAEVPDSLTLLERESQRNQRTKGHEVPMKELPEVNPEELTEADAQMWYRAKNSAEHPVKKKDFSLYANDADSSGNMSRKIFKAVIINKIKFFYGND